MNAYFISSEIAKLSQGKISQQLITVPIKTRKNGNLELIFINKIVECL